MHQLPENLFRCCVTSPPYWGLRDYAAEGQIGAEANPDDYVEHLVEVFERVKRVLTADDISIREKLPSGNFRNLVAVEIKGGKDYSNIHNRIGEAEKSHQKARKEGFVECWTIVGVSSIDAGKARKKSPSTDLFFGLEAIVRPGSDEFRDFREHLLSRVGVKD